MYKPAIAVIAACLAVAGCKKPANQDVASNAPEAAPPASDEGQGGSGGPGGGGFGPPESQTLDQMLERSHQRFARMDLDGDGKVTQDELKKAREQFEAQRAQGGIGGGPGGPGGGGGFRGGRGGGLFGNADANHDGVITMSEMDDSTKARFARLDANKDGTVTRDEMRAAFQGGPGGGAPGGSSAPPAD